MIKKILNRKFVWGFLIVTWLFQIAICIYQPERAIPFFSGVCSGVATTLMFFKEDKTDDANRT